MDTFLDALTQNLPQPQTVKSFLSDIVNVLDPNTLDLKNPNVDAFIGNVRAMILDELQDLGDAIKVDPKALDVASVKTGLDSVKDDIARRVIPLRQQLSGVQALNPKKVQNEPVAPQALNVGQRVPDKSMISKMKGINPGQWSSEDDEDLNGADWIGSQEGEVLTRETRNVILVQPWLTVPSNPLERIDIPRDEYVTFMALNIIALQQADPTINDREKAAIALHRYYALRDGLVSPSFDPKTYFVKYSECVWATESEINAAIAFMQAHNDFLDVLTKEIRTWIRRTFIDRVCLVSFVFRVRGHHYMNSFEELYMRVWQKCRYEMSHLGITFQNLATAALHAIFPIVLDLHWTNCVNDGRCNGALIKRYASACAGCAGPYVVQQGVQDIEQIAPGVRKHLTVAIAYLETLMPRLEQHRYAGSVNHSYYGVARVVIDERRLGAAAAVVKAAIDGLASGDPLGQSAALKRIAKYAPVTGAVLARAIGNLSNRPEVVNPLLESV